MIAAAVVVVVAVQRPVTAPDLWWHLARGRCVFDGSVTPSQDLLVLDSAAEADWLSGAPFYLAHSVAGNAALSAVPLLSVVLLLLLAGRELRRDRAVWAPCAWPVILVGMPLMLWVVREGLQPVPHLFDLVGMIALWWVLRSERSSRLRLVLVGFLFALWANLGPRPLWGLLVLTALCPPERFQVRLFAAALLGGCLTPRGVCSWTDAAVLFAPALWSPEQGIWPVDWRGIVSPLRMDFAALCFVVLWSLWAACGWPLRSQKLRLIRWSVPLLAAILNRANLPACGLWILLDVCQSPGQLASLKRLAAARWLVPLGLAAGGLMIIDAAGRALPPYERLGGGIAQQLDYRLLDRGCVEASASENPIAWALDGRSVGTVLWALPRVRMLDHPQRALLGGRLRRHVDLRDDVVSAHRAAYRRDDGSWGGWVRTLGDWNTNLVFVPMEEVEAHRALVESPWRPVDLDSPTVPYVDAHQNQDARMIVDVIQQQAFVEVGPWQPTIEIYDDQGWRWDALELAGWGADPAPAIRQSQLFRGLDIPLASLRALLPVRRQADPPNLCREFARCQADLAYQEWFTFGQSSWFRQLVVDTLHGPTPAVERADWMTPPPGGPSTSESDWEPGLSFYLRGMLPEAAEQLAGGDPQQQYAAAMIWLEAGDPLRARDVLARLERTTTEADLRIAAGYWKQQIEIFQRPNVAARAAVPTRDPA